MDIPVHFAGPFSWPGAPEAPSVFDAEDGKRSGIYLWTVPSDHGYRVYYVGETGRSFRIRLFDHYKEHASGMYHLYDPARFVLGEKHVVWTGKYDPDITRTERECVAEYPRISGVAWTLASMYRFFLAPLSCGRRERRRIEGAISVSVRDALRNSGDLQDKGIRYARRSGTEPELSCAITSSAQIYGLPSRVLG